MLIIRADPMKAGASGNSKMMDLVIPHDPYLAMQPRQPHTIDAGYCHVKI